MAFHDIPDKLSYTCSMRMSVGGRFGPRGSLSGGIPVFHCDAVLSDRDESRSAEQTVGLSDCQTVRLPDFQTVRLSPCQTGTLSPCQIFILPDNDLSVTP